MRCSIKSVLFSSFAGLEGFTTKETETTEDSKAHKARSEDFNQCSGCIFALDILISY